MTIKNPRQRYQRLYKSILNEYRQSIANALKDQIEYFIGEYQKNQSATPDYLPTKYLARSIVRIHFAAGVTNARAWYKDLSRQVKKGAAGDDLLRYQWVIINYLKNHLLDNSVTPITNTTRRQIEAVLQRSIAEGWGVNQTVSALRQTELTAARAENIVRTETTRAANYGAMIGASDTNLLTNKVWISAQDNRTRRIPRDNFDHLHMNEVQTSFEGKFIVPSLKVVEALEFPGDPNASAGNVCNCRCCVAFEPVRDNAGKLISTDRMPPQGTISALVRTAASIEITTILIAQLINEITSEDVTANQ